MGTTTAVLPDQRKAVTDDSLDHDTGLYRHKKRPRWGMAILAWEKDDRRAYQFEDGRLRKFKKGYYSFMEPVTQLDRSEETVISGLEAALEAHEGEDPPEPLEPVASFDAQIALFRELYPEGFHDPDWVSDHRHSDSGRVLKRHREPAAAKARETLAPDRVRAAIAEGRHADVVEAVTDLLAGTSLVALKQVKPLKRLDDDETRRFAEVVARLLHGEGDFSPRFREYLGVLKSLLDGRPSWRLGTALPALYWPEEHVCVRRSAFKRQAAAIAPLARYSKRARVRPYNNYRRMAFIVKDRLEEAGLEPRDMLDVHDFVWATLRSAALDHLNGDDD